MTSAARARAGETEAARQEGDAEHLPFGDASFDTVVCALSLCAIPGPATAIGEMNRVLVPGGQLLLLDHIGSTGRWSTPPNGSSNRSPSAPPASTAPAASYPSFSSPDSR